MLQKRPADGSFGGYLHPDKPVHRETKSINSFRYLDPQGISPDAILRVTRNILDHEPGWEQSSPLLS